MDTMPHPYHLENDEHLLWHGGPRPESSWQSFVAALPAALPAILFALNSRTPLAIRVFFLVFAALYSIVSALIVAKKKRDALWCRQWLYRLTNKRLVVEASGKLIRYFGCNVPLSDIRDIDITAGQDGAGTVAIGYADGASALGPLKYISLRDVANPAEFRALIDAARKKAQT